MGDVIDIVVNLNAKGFEKGSKQLKGAIKSMGNSAKQFGNMAKGAVKSIIGIGSAYAIISKAVSTYMSQNEKLSAQMNGVWTALGNLLGPIIERIIGWVTSAVSYLLTFLKMLGITTKSASQLSKSAKGAGGELKKTIAGFDELNTLSDNSGGGANGQLSDMEPTEFMKKIEELIAGKKWRELGQTIMGKVHEFLVGLPGKLSELIGQVDWKEIGNAIREFIKGIFDGIDITEVLLAWNEFWHNLWNAFLDFLWGLMSDDTENEPPLISALRELGDAYFEFRKTVIECWDKIKPVLEEIWHTYLEPIANWLLEIGLPAILDDIRFAFDELAAVFNGDKSIFEAFFEVIGRTIGTTVKLIIDLLSRVDWAKLWDDFKKGMSTGWDKVKKWFTETFFEDGKFTMKKFFDGILENLKNVSLWIMENILNPFLDGFLSAFGLDGTKGKLDEIGGRAIDDFFGGLKDKWDAVYKWAADAVNTLLGYFKFDWELPKIKMPHFSVSEWIEFAGIKIPWGINVDWYAKGGIVDGATLIGAGEAGKEAIVPLERNTGWINMVADGLIERLQAKTYHVNNDMATLDAIAERVAFRMPSFANGSVTPYSVSSAGGYNSSNADNSEILRLLAEFYELLLRLVEEMDGIQFVAQFDDIRALAKRITKEQKRQTISEGR